MDAESSDEKAIAQVASVPTETADIQKARSSLSLWLLFCLSLICFSCLCWHLLTRYGVLVPFEQRFTSIKLSSTKAEARRLLGEPDRISDSKSGFLELIRFMVPLDGDQVEHWIYLPNQRDNEGVKKFYLLIWRGESLVAKQPRDAAVESNGEK